MTPRQIQKLTGALRERHKVLSELIRLELIGRGDQAHVASAVAIQEAEGTSPANDHRKADLMAVELHIEELDDIANAESRFANGTFGICVDCGREIRFKRLAMYPTAKRCIECQTMHEHKTDND